MKYSQILARGATVDDSAGMLFDAYLVVPCYNFKIYMKQKHNDYLDGSLTITHKALVAFGKPSLTGSRITVSWELHLPTMKRSWLWRPRSSP